MKKYFTKEVKIALATIICTAMLLVGIDYLKGINILKPANYYYIEYKNVAGLTVSTPITIDGFKIGLVRAIEYDFDKPGKIVVEISLDNKLKLTTGTRGVLGTDLLGTATLEIRLNPESSTYYQPGDTIIGENTKSLMGNVQEDILPQLQTMLPRIDSILSGIQTLVSDPALSNALKNIDQISANLNRSSAQLHKILNNQVPDILDNFAVVSTNLNEFSTEIKGIDLHRTFAYADSTLINLNNISSQLTSEKGTLGLLLNDVSLYKSLVSTANSADSLLLDLRLHPKRYVHFSLFGRKGN